MNEDERHEARMMIGQGGMQVTDLLLHDDSIDAIHELDAVCERFLGILRDGDLEVNRAIGIIAGTAMMACLRHADDHR